MILPHGKLCALRSERACRLAKAPGAPQAAGRRPVTLAAWPARCSCCSLSADVPQEPSSSPARPGAAPGTAAAARALHGGQYADRWVR